MSRKYHRLPSEILQLDFYDFAFNVLFSERADAIALKDVGADRLSGELKLGQMLEVIMKKAIMS